MTRWMMRLLLRPVYRALRPPITLVALFLLVPLVGLNNCAPETGSMSAPTAAPDAASQPANFDFTGRVTRIADGDTFRISSQSARIRDWSLDAPETTRPGGAAATAALSRMISGQTLACRIRDIDRYGRIVGQCFLPDGRDIAAAMIASGTAREFCRYSRNYHYRTC